MGGGGEGRSAEWRQSCYGSLGCYSRHRASAARCCSSSSARCSARGVRGPAGASAALYAAFLSTRWRSACGGLGRALGVGTRSSRAPPAPPASRRLVERDNLALRRLNLGVELVALPLQLVSLLRRLDDEVRLPRDSRDTAETQPRHGRGTALMTRCACDCGAPSSSVPSLPTGERGGQVRAHTRCGASLDAAACARAGVDSPASMAPGLPSRLALLAESRSTRSSRSVSACEGGPVREGALEPAEIEPRCDRRRAPSWRGSARPPPP